MNYPVGPFELMDLAGVDIAFHVTDYLYRELNKENKWATTVTLKSMVREGKIGRKVGKGWYKY
ncbi:MAG: hypothetical protein A2161_16845 [Candidatus Schekmanbacteria bacterium RBG_13_48_7]|jgi:3-hydroxybutyryl-CoA dehydrogenase|uniref:3-hydroxyacyl-CoA dehydrogenase C-terminal domain-containing protein n=1 Tax=Candidatus Schekmanbacteria bacterium RBG_13_48_7 TaxID=1817878 RepID=A0A1F7S3S9_9BACT|nr:MAG: hypothetical protein A2161_16845 [Candidatus Schekmanbacteria bacterium RBG_13_48_7]